MHLMEICLFGDNVKAKEENEKHLMQGRWDIVAFYTHAMAALKTVLEISIKLKNASKELNSIKKEIKRVDTHLESIWKRMQGPGTVLGSGDEDIKTMIKEDASDITDGCARAQEIFEERTRMHSLELGSKVLYVMYRIPELKDIVAGFSTNTRRIDERISILLSDALDRAAKSQKKVEERNKKMAAKLDRIEEEQRRERKERERRIAEEQKMDIKEREERKRDREELINLLKELGLRKVQDVAEKKGGGKEVDGWVDELVKKGVERKAAKKGIQERLEAVRSESKVQKTTLKRAATDEVKKGKIAEDKDKGNKTIEGRVAASNHIWILCVDNSNGARSIMAQTYLELLRAWTMNTQKRWLFQRVQSVGLTIPTDFTKSILEAEKCDTKKAHLPASKSAISAISGQESYFQTDDPDEKGLILKEISAHVTQGLFKSHFQRYEHVLCFDEDSFELLEKMKKTLVDKTETKKVISKIQHIKNCDWKIPEEEITEEELLRIAGKLKVALKGFLKKEFEWEKPAIGIANGEWRTLFVPVGDVEKEVLKKDGDRVIKRIWEKKGATKGSLKTFLDAFKSNTDPLGIPYAQPPIGDLRFAAPVIFSGNSTINGTNFGFSCISQLSASTNETIPTNITLTSAAVEVLNVLESQTAESEDCLTLNVWTKPQTGETKKAVLLWIYGGGFSSGSSSIPGYNGENIAGQEDVVVVSINYRLTIFGFPGNPASTQNLGLLDQRLAVEWVRDNIAAFGGDPSRITLFGQSAGGASVDLYSYAWIEDPIVAGFIPESGTAFSFGLPFSVDKSSALWYNVSSTLDCGGESSDASSVLSCMRQKNYTDILKAIPLASGVNAEIGAFGPTVDDTVVFANYTAQSEQGKFIQKPMLIGSNNYEASLFIINLALENYYYSDVFWDAFNLQEFTCPAGIRANASVENRIPIWRYRYFGIFPDINLYLGAGSYHTAEILLLFDTLPSTPAATEAEISIANYMRGAWTAFAKDPVNGLTNYGGGWPQYDPSQDTLVRLAYDNVTGTNLASPDVYDRYCYLVNTSNTNPDAAVAIEALPSSILSQLTGLPESTTTSTASSTSTTVTGSGSVNGTAPATPKSSSGGEKKGIMMQPYCLIGTVGSITEAGQAFQCGDASTLHQQAFLASYFIHPSDGQDITELYFYGQSPAVLPSPVGIGTGDWADSYAKAVALVAQMTTIEKVNLTGGISDPTSSCAGVITNISRLGFPGLCLQDSGNGVRATDFVNGYPSGLHTGASWNKALANQRAIAMGGEFRAKGVNVALGPVVGPLGRIAVGGRNWEGFANDPYLAGALGAATVKGMKSVGVITSVKHFITNEQETDRNPANNTAGQLVQAVSSNVDDKTIHELYLWPFQDAVYAGTGNIMCSYNRINNSYASQNSKVLNGFLKEELGFQGFVVSDWGAQHTGYVSALAGLDMAMPTPAAFWGDALVQAVENGSVPTSRLDDMATRILATWYHYGQDQNYTARGIGMPTSFTAPHVIVNAKNPASRPTLLQGAIEGHVLVKNINSSLPLKSPQLLSIFGYDANGPDIYAAGSLEWGFGYELFNITALLGAGTTTLSQIALGSLVGGGGSGGINPAYWNTPFDALSQRAYQDSTSLLWDFTTPDSTTTVDVKSDACLVFINAFSSEGFDRVALHDDFSDGIVANVASQCSNTIVVIHNAGVRLVDVWIENPNVTAVIYAHLPGQDSGRALVSLLYGDENFSGKLPYTVAKNESDYGTLVSPSEPEGEFEFFPQSNFTEGVYIDYRAFDQKNITPRYEFGFGLSYTSFTFSALSITHLAPGNTGPYPIGEIQPGGAVDLWDEWITVTANIQNTGPANGTEVAQLYLGIPGGPVRQLRGFEKVAVDIAGSTNVRFVLTRRDLSLWDVDAQKWRIPGGEIPLSRHDSQSRTYNATAIRNERRIRKASPPLPPSRYGDLYIGIKREGSSRQYSSTRSSASELAMEQHNASVSQIAAAVRSFHSRNEKFRISHGSTNSTRPRPTGNTISTSSLSHVLAVDVERQTALVEPNVPMDRLVEATLKYNLIPPVVMEFPGITVGGGYSGTSGESSSFTHGFFNETLNWVEMVLANGDEVRCSREERGDLFWGAAGAVGTLGVTTLLEVRLRKAKKYVQVGYERVRSMEEATRKIEGVMKQEQGVDYLDGIMFSKNDGAVITGVLTDTPTPGLTISRFSHASDPWFYMHVQEMISSSPSSPTIHEAIPLAEYLFRYDRAGFWVGRSAFSYFKFPFHRLTRWFLDDFLHTRMMYTALHASGESKKYVVQDLALPFRTAEQFVRFTEERTGIYPLWLCPLKQSEVGPTMHPHRDELDSEGKFIPLLNIGLWGYSKSHGEDMVQVNRDIESKLKELGGMKWLYAHTYYQEHEFWDMYDRGWYDALRTKYGAQGLPSVWEKVRVDVDVQGKQGKAWKWPWGGLYGIWKAIRSGSYKEARRAEWRDKERSLVRIPGGDRKK
ncbi:hypothetical protein B7494_g1320 [Chlorociboria aeruginascens]|nr:hypothetical protein B7494_g1320 [Chlorociboria aeruginascens]